MKIVYEQGDIVYNLNNFSYGVILQEKSNDTVQLLESGDKGVFINCPPKSALVYVGHMTFKESLDNIIHTTIRKGPLRVIE